MGVDYIEVPEAFAARYQIEKSAKGKQPFSVSERSTRNNNFIKHLQVIRDGKEPNKLGKEVAETDIMKVDRDL